MEQQTESTLWLKLLLVSASLLAVSLGSLQLDVVTSSGLLINVVLFAGLGVGLLHVGRLIGLLVAEPEHS